MLVGGCYIIYNDTMITPRATTVQVYITITLLCHLHTWSLLAFGLCRLCTLANRKPLTQTLCSRCYITTRCGHHLFTVTCEKFSAANDDNICKFQYIYTLHKQKHVCYVMELVNAINCACVCDSLTIHASSSQVKSGWRNHLYAHTHTQLDCDNSLDTLMN